MIAWSPPLKTLERPSGLPPFAADGDRGIDDSRPPEGLPAFAQAPSDRVSGARALFEIVTFVGLALLLTASIKTFVAQPFFIPSGSMRPQLVEDDRIVVSKLSYRLHEPRRGDIVVFDAPPSAARVPQEEPRRNLPTRIVRKLGELVGVIAPSTEEYVKRVIALPGETVEVREGAVFIDGRRLEEPYLPPGVVTTFAPQKDGPQLPLKVAEGELWVMGDNRGASNDSRVFGPIEQDTVVGRAFVKVWPVRSISFL